MLYLPKKELWVSRATVQEKRRFCTLPREISNRVPCYSQPLRLYCGYAAISLMSAFDPEALFASRSTVRHSPPGLMSRSLSLSISVFVGGRLSAYKSDRAMVASLVVFVRDAELANLLLAAVSFVAGSFRYFLKKTRRAGAEAQMIARWASSWDQKKAS